MFFLSRLLILLGLLLITKNDADLVGHLPGPTLVLELQVVPVLLLFKSHGLLDNLSEWVEFLKRHGNVLDLPLTEIGGVKSKSFFVVAVSQNDTGTLSPESRGSSASMHHGVHIFGAVIMDDEGDIGDIDSSGS